MTQARDFLLDRCTYISPNGRTNDTTFVSTALSLKSQGPKHRLPVGTAGWRIIRKVPALIATDTFGQRGITTCAPLPIECFLGWASREVVVKGSTPTRPSAVSGRQAVVGNEGKEDTAH